MTDQRFRCAFSAHTLVPCPDYAKVTIRDSDGEIARLCPRHAVEALFNIRHAEVAWDDTKGLNEHQVKALQIAEERAAL